METDAGSGESPGDEDAAGESEPAVDREHPILLFDGVCNLCSGSVQFVIERDPGARFRFAPLQSDVADEVLAPFDVDGDDLSTVVLVEGNEARSTPGRRAEPGDAEVFTKSDAALRVARDLDGPVSLLWYARFVPRSVRDAAYDLVAATRYDLFGQKDRCMVPDPDVRDRFLETSG